jgi:hypothetical protein
MSRFWVAFIVVLHVVAVGGTARADGPMPDAARVRALAGAGSFEGSVATGGNPRALPLTDSGDAGESIFCLTFTRQETRRTFGIRGAHVYACFNFLRDPSEAVGAVLDKRGRPRCLVTGTFRKGSTPAGDCLVLALCEDVFLTGACGQ